MEFVEIIICLRRPCFLFRQETGERTGQRGFPLCDSPTPAGNSARSNARLPELCADSGLPARPSPMSMHTPFRSHARRCRRRRDGRHSLSVLPETGWKLAHSRSRSQAATSRFRSSARRRRGSRHAGGIPKGKALWSLLPTSGEAEVGNARPLLSQRVPSHGIGPRRE